MIEPQQLEAVGDYLAEHGLSERSRSEVHARVPGVHLAWCLEDELGADEPMVEGEQFNLYLIDGSNHCMSLTRDLQSATGILIAEIEEA